MNAGFTSSCTPSTTYCFPKSRTPAKRPCMSAVDLQNEKNTSPTREDVVLKPDHGPLNGLP